MRLILMRKRMFSLKISLKKSFIALLMTALLSGFCFSALSAVNTTIKKDGIAAIVNNSVILESEVANLTDRITKQTDKKNLPAPKLLRKQIIDQLINEALIMQEAEKNNIKISDQELNQAIARVAAQNNLTVAQLTNYLKSIGLNFNEYKEQIRRDMIMDKIRMAELHDRIRVSDYELNNATKNIKQQPIQNFAVNLSHILIALPEKPTQNEIKEAQKKVNLILDKLSQGESFSKLAMTYSNDDLALNGGSMGWNDVNALPSLFELHAMHAKKGEVIGPIRSNVGFHLLKVNDVKGYQAPKVNVTEVNAQHILLTTNVILDDAEAQAKLKQLRESILDGKITFEQAANLYSEDPGSKNKGGELGWADPNAYDPVFKKELLKLKPNQISEPIKTPFGWHLIKMNGLRTVDKTEAAQKDQAYRMIFNRKFNEESQIWAQSLRGDAYIKIFDEDKE